jgi:hypothetical protein
MKAKEIQQFSDIYRSAQSYFCYLFSNNIPNQLPNIQLEQIVQGLQTVVKEVKFSKGFYVLDANGVQIANEQTQNLEFCKDKDCSKDAFLHKILDSKRCGLTDPFPAPVTNKLITSAAFPVFNDKNELIYIACIDIPLESLLKIIHPTSLDSTFGMFSRLSYGILSVILSLVGLLLFVKAVDSFVEYGFRYYDIKIETIFESVILITLALAIFDLVKTIFEEEVLGRHDYNAPVQVHKTMIRFLGSIVIALSIESLMLVFKFALYTPDKILYAVYILVGVALLLFGLGFYMRMAQQQRSK